MTTPITPFGLRLIVRRYQYPKMIHSLLFLPLDEDKSGTLWDLVAWNDKVEKYLGVELHERTILSTPSDVAVPIMDNLFIIPAHAVTALHQWEQDGGNDDFQETL